MLNSQFKYFVRLNDLIVTNYSLTKKSVSRFLKMGLYLKKKKGIVAIQNLCLLLTLLYNFPRC